MIIVMWTKIAEVRLDGDGSHGEGLDGDELLSLCSSLVQEPGAIDANWLLWHIDPSTAPLRPTYSRVLLVLPTWHPDDSCGLLPHIVWTFRPFVSLQSASGRFRFLVPPPETTCLSTSHLRRHSRFSDNDSKPFCLSVPNKTHYHMTRVLLLPYITTVWTPVVLAIINII